MFLGLFESSEKGDSDLFEGVLWDEEAKQVALFGWETGVERRKQAPADQ